MPLAISGIAFVIFTVLLFIDHIGEASYCFLVAATALLGLVLHGFGRLQELDLKNLRLVLRKIEKTKKDLFVREEKLKAIATPLAQLIAFSGASEGRLESQESWAAKRKWYKQKIESLISALQLSSAEAEETLKYMQKYSEIDDMLTVREGLKKTDIDAHKETREKLHVLNTELVEMMKKDVAN